MHAVDDIERVEEADHLKLLIADRDVATAQLQLEYARMRQQQAANDFRVKYAMADLDRYDDKTLAIKRAARPQPVEAVKEVKKK